MRRFPSVQFLIQLPALLWFLSCMWSSMNAYSKSSEAWEKERVEIDKLYRAEVWQERFFHMRNISAASASALAEGAQSQALIWMSMGALAMGATASLLGVRLYRCEKRLQKLEEELARERAPTGE